MKHPSLPDFGEITEFENLLKTKPESFWLERGEAMALQLFHDMAERVPAYKQFLSEHNLDHAKIRTIHDFKRVPTIDKDNYLRKYPLRDLVWDGSLGDQHWVVSTTSGSTGEPYYFPRTDLQDEYYALTAELYLRENFKIYERSTLYIDAFAMGAWIGGLFTYEAVHRVAQKGYALSVITPGINKKEVINAVRNMGGHFDQVIIGCYPPMMRDIIDYGNEEGINWGAYNLGIVFSAEGFSERFRDYIADNAKLENIYTSSLNHYGTVDLGTMSHETPLSIMVRRQAAEDTRLSDEVFHDAHKQPTFTQYMPELFFFESDSGDRVICSSYSGIPLVRYDLRDRGAVLTMRELEDMYATNGKDLAVELRKAGLETTRWNLPFVSVFERSDFSINLMGGVIYPTEIQRVLIQPAFSKKLTGKFTMEVVYDLKMRPKLVVHAELRRDVPPQEAPLKKAIQKAIVESLLSDNTEYISNHAAYGKQVWPTIKLWPYENPIHFSGKGKQKWVK